MLRRGENSENDKVVVTESDHFNPRLWVDAYPEGRQTFNSYLRNQTFLPPSRREEK